MRPMLKLNEPGGSTLYLHANSVDAIRVYYARTSDKFLVKVFTSVFAEPIVLPFDTEEEAHSKVAWLLNVLEGI